MFDRIEAELLEALKAGDETRKNVLRMLKSSLKNFQIEQGRDLTDEEITTIIGREVKKRKESILAYEQADKPDLAKEEKAELEVLAAYLPAQMDEAAIRQAVADYLAENPTTADQIGQAMGQLSAQLKGQADLGLVSKILRESIK